MSTDNQFRDEPCFVISVAARIVGVHAQTLRHYERVGLIWPSRTVGRQRLYSMADIDRLHRLKALTEDMGLNLAGAEVAMKLMKRIEELEAEVNQLTEAVNILQRQELRPGQNQGQDGAADRGQQRNPERSPQGSAQGTTRESTA